MDVIKQYLLSITVAAIICGIGKCISDEKTLSGAMIRLISGLIMAVTVISPVVKLDLAEIPAFSSALIEEGKELASQGEKLASMEQDSLISSRMEAYILDKAKTFGATPQVEVQLNDAVPESVIIRGAVSPYAKKLLQQIIADDLGIAKEDQRWIG